VDGRLNDRRHDIAGGKDHRPRLDLAAVIQLNADRARGGIEIDGFGLE
jgi:hypothetical protein